MVTSRVSLPAAFQTRQRLLTGSLGSFMKFVMRVLFYPTPQGALTQLWAGTSPDTANFNGKVSASPSPGVNEAHVMRCSISSLGRELVNLAATTQNLGESFGLGSKNRLPISDLRYFPCLARSGVSVVFFSAASYSCPNRRLGNGIAIKNNTYAYLQ
jgi:hypothetical protein